MKNDEEVIVKTLAQLERAPGMYLGESRDIGELRSFLLGMNVGLCYCLPEEAMGMPLHQFNMWLLSEKMPGSPGSADYCAIIRNAESDKNRQWELFWELWGEFVKLKGWG